MSDLQQSDVVTRHRSLLLSGVLFALADWLMNCVYYICGWQIHPPFWVKYFDLEMLSEGITAFCAGLIVLLSQAYGSPRDASHRNTLAFSATVGVLFYATRWCVWAVAFAVSYEIPVAVYVGIFLALSAAAAFAIYRFRWRKSDDARRGFPVFISAQTPSSPPDKSSPPASL